MTGRLSRAECYIYIYTRMINEVDWLIRHSRHVPRHSFLGLWPSVGPNEQKVIIFLSPSPVDLRFSKNNRVDRFFRSQPGFLFRLALVKREKKSMR